MSGKNFDVFISYRRSDGTDKARILDLAFGIDDCRTFLDFKSIGARAFDKRLEDAVIDAPVFVMVLTPDYFARCNEKGDWVRKEIELALDNGKKIIPINYDSVLNGVPDYLDEEFRKRIGCHSFLDLHHGTSFNDAVKGIFEREIRPYLSPIHNNDDKAKVSVKTDADCELILDDEIVATVQAGKTKQVFVERGEHFFTARSTEFPQIEEEIEKVVNDLKFKYTIIIKLADKLPIKPSEPVEPPQAVTPTPTIVPQVPKVESISPNDLRLLRTLQGHSNCVNSVVASPDGKYLASGSLDETIKLWDAKSGECIRTLEGHSDVVSSVCWSPDEKYLASCSTDNTLKMWDAESGECIRTLEGHSDVVSSVCWSPDGKYLASGSADNTIKLWDAKSGGCISTLIGHSFVVWSVSWSPDGKYLVSGSWDETIKIWDAKSWKCIRTLEGHSYVVLSVCWSPDGKYLASCSGDCTLKLWDANSGECIRTLEKHSKPMRSVCWGSDGKYLAIGLLDGEIEIWDVE